jgi:hypothetical protein
MVAQEAAPEGSPRQARRIAANVAALPELLRKLGPEFAALADEINGVNLSSQDARCRPGNANACLIVSPGN